MPFGCMHMQMSESAHAVNRPAKAWCSAALHVQLHCVDLIVPHFSSWLHQYISICQSILLLYRG